MIKLGVKFAPEFKEKDIKMFDVLEERGVPIAGVELQMLKNTTFAHVYDTLDSLKAYNLSFIGIHPPFPTFNKETKPWVDEFENNKHITYIVLHAGTKNGFDNLKSELTLQKCFVENIKPGQKADEQVLGDLTKIAKTTELPILFDMAHAMLNHSRGIFQMSPVEQVKAVANRIKAVHTADDGCGDGNVIINGGTSQFRKLFDGLLKNCPDAFYISETKGGHFNENRGHIENVTAIWQVYNEFKDKSTLL